jgi:peptidoglycan-associated lipoprotein
MSRDPHQLDHTPEILGFVADVLIVLGAVVALGLFPGCGKKKGPAPPSPTFDDHKTATGARSDEPGTATLTPVGKDAGDAPAIGPIYFTFDSTDLSDDSRRALDRYGAWLAAHEVHVIVEGHADERGTTEYNVALGQRRAQVIRDFLVHLGVDASHVDTISYGEERPAVCGDDESAWAQNRRGVVQPRH